MRKRHEIHLDRQLQETPLHLKEAQRSSDSSKACLTQDPHVIFALLLVLRNQVVEVVGEVLEQGVLLVHFQTQDTVQELGDGAV